MLRQSHTYPKTWPSYHLSDLYTERNEPGADGLPILSVSIHSGVSDCEFGEDELGKRVKRSEDKSLYKRCHPGDLVFNMMRAWQGAFGVVKVEGMVSPAYIVAVPNEIVYPPFMDYFMRTHEMIYRINTQSYGLMDFRKRLYWDSFAKIKCVLPGYAEQKKIAAILSTQDRVIELKERRIEEKQLQKKFLVQDLLRANSHSRCFSGKWEKVKLSKILRERTEKQADQNLRICSVAVEKGVVDQIEHLGRKFAAEDTSNYHVVEYGDVIYTKSPTGKFPYGIIKQSHLHEKVSVSPLYAIYIPDSFEIGYILHSYFNYERNTNNYLLPVIQKGAKNTININNESFLSNTVSLPMDKAEQKRIAQVFITADRELSLLRADLEQERQKKKALMQLLLSGLVRVNAKGGEADGAV